MLKPSPFKDIVSDNPNPEPCGSSLVSGPELTNSMEDSCSDVIDEVPGVYP